MMRRHGRKGKKQGTWCREKNTTGGRGRQVSPCRECRKKWRRREKVEGGNNKDVIAGKERMESGVRATRESGMPSCGEEPKKKIEAVVSLWGRQKQEMKGDEKNRCKRQEN